MLKLSAVIGIVGIALLALSFVPRIGTAVESQRVASPPPTAAYGQALFEAKGCASCHVHQAVATSRNFGYHAGPDLSNYQGNPVFLRQWLRNPQAIRPTTPMPDLDLSDGEIEGLITFLSQNNHR